MMKILMWLVVIALVLIYLGPSAIVIWVCSAAFAFTAGFVAFIVLNHHR